MTTDYTPIDCAAHSQFELAVLRRRPIHLTWSVGNVVFDQLVLPLDLKTQAHEEFLIVQLQSGERRMIRLDYIRRMEHA